MKNNNTLSLFALGATLLVAGCQYDATTRYDGVTTHAGNHLAVNEAKMVVDPWNRNAYNNNIEGDGKRLGDAAKRYQSTNSEEAGNSQQTVLLPALAGSETK